MWQRQIINTARMNPQQAEVQKLQQKEAASVACETETRPPPHAAPHPAAATASPR
jgi:hypothetical protein